MPAAIGIENEEDMVTGMFQGADREIVLGETEKLLCDEYLSINQQLKELEDRKAAIAVTLKERIVQESQGGAERKAHATAKGYSISWSRYETVRTDTDALKKAGLFDQYSKKIESGSFRITAKKGAA